MKRLLLTLALLLVPASAFAQCNGIFPSNTVCGNPPGAPNLPRPSNPSIFAGSAGGSNGQIQYNSSGALAGATGGDVQMSGTQTLIQPNAVTNSKINPGTAGTVKGTVSGSITDVLASTITNTACTITPSTCATLLGYYSPIWYGAVCDGVTNDATNFQTALNAAITAAAPLQIPNANCSLGANITNSTNSAVIIIRGAGSLSQVSFTGTFGFVFTGQAQYFNWTRFAINCGATVCLSISNSVIGVANSYISNLTINGGGTNGAVFFHNMSQTEFVNNRIITNTAAAYGIFIDNTQTSDAGGDSLINNIIININGSAGTACINLVNVGGVRVLGNACSGYVYGIFNSLTIAGGSTGIQENDNQLDNLTNGIQFQPSGAGITGGTYAHVTTNGNVIHASTAAGAGIIATTSGTGAFMLDWSINSNTISTLNGGPGIAVKGVTNYTIGPNVIADQGTAVSQAVQTQTPGGTCFVIGVTVNNWTPAHLSNGATCATSGGTN